ncbi:MAG: glycosyltransferase family 4 protein, partial [bacterium]|nr:glycosyltransferase family 4 protein [bacterium]MDZ4296392.1 glycosyltransferase family 4 protein [Patescibacteria group bacterium]
AIQRFQFYPLRLVEGFVMLLRLRFSGYRTVYVHYSFLAAFTAALVMRPTGGRVFYWNCGLPWLYRRSIAREFFERLTYRLITHLVTGTQSLAYAYARHYGIPVGRTRVMPNWIDTERIKNQESKIRRSEFRAKLKIAAGRKAVLFIHRLSRRKGADLLPEIIRELDDEHSVCFIIGEGPERRAIESRIKNYGLKERARFCGAVPNRDLYQYYAVADALIMPSREEGFPRVLLEAMAFGVPFVASDVGGVRDIIPPSMYEYLVSGDDPQDFALSLRQLLVENASVLDELRYLLYAWVQRYDIDAVSRLFVELTRE